MSSEAEAKPAVFVPACFDDLKRDTNPNRPNLPLGRDDGPADLTDLAGQDDFMKKSGLIAGGAAVIGALLMLLAYARPIIDTFGAFDTAGQVAAAKAGEGVQKVQGAAQGAASQAAFVKETDEKAINTAKGGLNCLTGKTACPNGTYSPFR